MPPFSRRTFFASAAAALPLAALVRRAHAAAATHLRADPGTLGALAEAILPSALGTTGSAGEAAAFRDWAANYREAAELNHGYGTSQLRASGTTPMTRWVQQLDALDSAAMNGHQRSFRELTLTQRQALVRSALAGERLDYNPGVVHVNHVALALLAHFFDSSVATDLCYEAKIGKLTCRPLSTSLRKPLPMLKVSER